MGRLLVDVLGAPQVRHGAAVLCFPTRKALALLVYLAVEGGHHSRDKLATLFWPDRDQTHARAMLRYTLARIRRTLNESPDTCQLVVEREMLGLSPASVELDLELLPATRGMANATGIAELRRVSAACRGEFMDGFSLPDAQGFDEWVSQQREYSQHRMELAFDRLSQLEAERGEPSEAARTVRQWLAVSPLNEEAHRRLMRLHFAAGDRSAALLAYAECRARLDHELHVRPAAETSALADRIRDAEPATREHRPAGRALGIFEGPLVGRTGEFARLVGLFHAAQQGLTQVVVVRGEPGIGKTRLAREFLAWTATQGADVLQGRAFETGGRLPYQPLVDALRSRLDRENAPEDLLSDVWLVELGRLLPELRERYPDLPAAAGDEAAGRMHLFEAIARLGVALALRAPTVLFIDDVQWADEGSLDALQYAGRRWTEARTPVLVVLNLRPEVLADRLALDEWLVNSLPRAVTLAQVELGPLTSDDTLRFVQGFVQAVGAEHSEIDDFAAWLYLETGGQPLFVVETLRALLEHETVVSRTRHDGGWTIELPAGRMAGQVLGGVPAPGVREVIRSRLARLTPAARDLLAAGAVLGQRFTFDQLCQVGSLSQEDALLATDQVLRAHLVREAGMGDGRAAPGAYVFAHDKIRDVVYAEAGTARRQVFHHRAMQTLQKHAAAALLAHHALAAGLDEAAVHFSGAAGDEAAALLAAADAIPHYERALEIATRLGWHKVVGDLHARCGKALASLARWVDARRELEAALDEVGEDQPQRRAEILVDLLEVCWWWLDVPALRRRAAEATSLAELVGRADLKSAAASWLVPTLAAAGDVAGCVVQGDQAFARGRALGLPPPLPVLAYMSVPFYWLGRIEEAVERGGESVQAARAANHTSATMFALPNLGMALAANGRYAEAAVVFDEARQFGREYGIGTMLARAISMSAGYHLDVSDFATNEALATEARELAASLSFTPPLICAGLDLMMNFARQHEVARAEALIDEIARLSVTATAWHDWLWRIRLAEARAEIALARQDWPATLRWAGVAIDEARVCRRVKYEVLAQITRGGALHALGRTRESIVELRSALALARPVGDPPLLLRAAAALLAVDGDAALADEAGAVADRIATALDDARMRACFEAALPHGLLARGRAHP